MVQQIHLSCVVDMTLKVMFPVHQVWPKPSCKAQWKTKQIEEGVGRQHQGMDRPGVRQVPEGSGEQGKMEKTGCKIIFGAPTTLAVKGLMMMTMKSARTQQLTIFF